MERSNNLKILNVHYGSWKNKFLRPEKVVAPVVQKADDAIQRINRTQANTFYPLDRNLSAL